MIVGVDVSKGKLDVVVLSTGKHYVIKNTKASIASFFKNKIKAQGIELVVFEATGGYERELHLYLSEQDIPHHRAHGTRVRRFGEAKGFFAKTDRIDAKLLALYGAQDEITADRPVSQKQLECQSIVAFIQRLKDQIQAEKNRMRTAYTKQERSFYKRHIHYLEKELLKAKESFNAMVSENETLQEKRELLKTMKGIGEEISGMLVACLPELGEVSRESISCLVGVAPRTNESGNHKGRSRISHGRFHVRRAIYMAALVSIRHNPKMKAFYKKLLARGKAKKVALIAVARKVLITLNAMVQNGTPWRLDFEEI